MDYSIIIPARNEEKNLPSCISSIKSAVIFAEKKLDKKLNFEFIVVCNRCTDKTEKVSKELGCKVLKSEAKNLSIIRNTGCFSAAGENLITIDADSTVSLNMIYAIEKKLLDKKVIGGGVMIFPERWSLGILLSGLALLPFALKEQIAAGLFFVRKDVFKEIGGFNEEFFSAEDVEFARNLRDLAKKTKRKNVILLTSYIITSCRKFDKFGDYYILKQLPAFFKLLKGKKSELADKIWYDFE